MPKYQAAWIVAVALAIVSVALIGFAIRGDGLGDMGTAPSPAPAAGQPTAGPEDF